MLTWDEIQSNAVAFSKRWKDETREEAMAQTFETELMRVFGVDDPAKCGVFEYKVPLAGGHNGYIDYLWKGQIAIEFKSKGKDLDRAYHQLQNYLQHLPEEEIPDLQMVCDFENIILYRRSTKENWKFKTKDLRKHIKRFANIAGYTTERVRENQIEVNVKAAEKMARLHDALKDHGYEGHDLEVYLVRLLFCMFADDTGIFPQDSLYNFIEASKADGSDLSERIGKLFEVLNMPNEVRAKRTLLSDELRRFRYINGGLFANLLPSAEFDAKMRQTLIDCVNFDWNKISPAIFGAMFQGVMDKNQRRELGAHYTSEENILKLINPLFLDDLWAEFDRVKTDPKALEQFHNKIAGLKFLDPACGCGNFLIITYRELRRLELEVLKMQSNSNQMLLTISSLLKVSVDQFYGIEYEDFPCQIAQVGMWLMDHQMNLKVSDYFGSYFARLPLTQSATIVHGNALRIDWEDVVPKRELSFILGNPPFVGYSNQSAEQKSDVLSVFLDDKDKPYKNAGKVDYVSMWHYKASKYMLGTAIRTAFVSTNSIVQGEQVAAIWEPLFKMFRVHIDFGYRTFVWSNEAKGKAAVHCVIVGFSSYANLKKKIIFDEDGNRTEANNINAYLVDAPDVFVNSRTKPLCDVPDMVYGNKPTDGGYFFFNDNDYAEFIELEPIAKKYIRKMYGATEYINNVNRYCLWLVNVNPGDLRKMPKVMERIEAVRAFRSSSTKQATRDSASTPTLFQEIRHPDSDYIIIPRHSSERRKYIPFGFVSPEIIVNDAVQMIPFATLYHFGILTSNIHNAWIRAVCGRIKSDYRYSKDIVYNNFPWPTPTDPQKAAIETAAQGVLDARAKFPESSLADLYDPLTMPPELIKAHNVLNKAVWAAYGFTTKSIKSEAECVARLMEMYRVLVENSC
ncbi:methylase [Clostridia bacterium]|nr:methylase [Clostridia bacterium]